MMELRDETGARRLIPIACPSSWILAREKMSFCLRSYFRAHVVDLLFAFTRLSAIPDLLTARAF